MKDRRNNTKVRRSTDKVTTGVVPQTTKTQAVRLLELLDGDYPHPTIRQVIHLLEKR